MNKIFTQYPNLCRLVLACLLIALSFFLGGLIATPAIKKIFPFTAMILLLTVTWVMYRLDNKNLSELGLNLNVKHIWFFFVGLIIGIIAVAASKLVRFAFTGENFSINDSFIWQSVMLSAYYLLPMAAVEELLFRGYLFKKVIQISSITKANILFSVIFTLVHVFDREVLGNPAKILFFTVSIPVGHLLFATALLKSKTLLFPIGLHWGNNWSTLNLISSEKTPSSVFYVVENSTFETWFPFIITILLYNGFFLFLTYIIWRWPEKKPGPKSKVER